MSVVCGIIQKDNRPVLEKTGWEMMDKLSVYKIDQCKSWYGKQAFMGCGIEYITPESKYEKLPFFEPSTGLSITADAIIDNRNDFSSSLGLLKSELKDISDSQLILTAYKKWGEECPKYLIGDFAFVIWDEKRRELFCARDHVGKRTFYYYNSPELFAYSTLVEPLFAVNKNKRGLNEAWISDFLSLGGVLHEIDSQHTIYNEIMQLPPAHILKINSNGITISRYWNPVDTPKLRLKSDYEYEEAFREVFFEAVKCRLRSSGDVGVMLSGGLDSGSVASVAARELDKRGEKLKAFSALPISEYKNWLPAGYIADESGYIEMLREQYKNIDITYCRSQGKNSFKDIERFLTILEQPYKIIENLFWVDEISSTAAKNGCKVLLDGQFGNLTISYGDFLTNILTLYRQFRWVSMTKEIKGYSELYGLRSGRVAKVAAKKIFKQNILNSLYRQSKNEDLNKMMIVNPDLADRWNTKERFRKGGFDPDNSRIPDLSQTRRFIANNVFFSQIGPLDTKVSLANGIAKRDPTRDKRVIEFCFSIPGEQYVRNGQERYLIRRAMKGILPDPVRTNIRVRGRQSADWIQRISPIWQEIKEEVEGMLQSERVGTYLNTSVLRRTLTNIEGSGDKESLRDEIRNIFISLIFYRFINNLKAEPN